MNKPKDKELVRRNRIYLRVTDKELAQLRDYQISIRAPGLSRVVTELLKIAAKNQLNSGSFEENKEKSPCTPYKENKEENFLVPNNSVICPAADKSATREKKILSLDERKEAFRLRLVPYVGKYGREMMNEFFAYWTERSENGKKMRFEMEKVFDVGRRLATWRKRDGERRFTRGQAPPTISPEQLRSQLDAKREREAKAQADYQQRVRDQEASQTPEAQAARAQVLAKFGKPWKRKALS